MLCTLVHAVSSAQVLCTCCAQLVIIMMDPAHLASRHENKAGPGAQGLERGWRARVRVREGAGAGFVVGDCFPSAGVKAFRPTTSVPSGPSLLPPAPAPGAGPSHGATVN